MALITERWWGPLFVLYGLVNRAGNLNNIPAGDAGSVQEIPD